MIVKEEPSSGYLKVVRHLEDLVRGITQKLLLASSLLYSFAPGMSNNVPSTFGSGYISHRILLLRGCKLILTTWTLCPSRHNRVLVHLSWIFLIPFGLVLVEFLHAVEEVRVFVYRVSVVLYQSSVQPPFHP